MAEPLRYITWDYDNHIAIEYERVGECNGCGACCMALIKFQVAGAANPDEFGMLGKTTSRDGGVWFEVRRGNLRRFFGELEVASGQACYHLDENFRCKIYDIRPLLHRIWPTSPEQVAPFEQCSYSFHEINRWSFEP